jgi:hypothetical protein
MTDVGGEVVQLQKLVMSLQAQLAEDHPETVSDSRTTRSQATSLSSMFASLANMQGHLARMMGSYPSEEGSSGSRPTKSSDELVAMTLDTLPSVQTAPEAPDAAMMLSPKPQKPPVTLPYAAMPHVLEAVIRYSSCPSLMALRKVCSGVRDLADAALLRHIVINVNDILVAPAGHFALRLPRCGWGTDPKFLTCVRILEIRADAIHLLQDTVDLIRSLRNLEVVVYHQVCYGVTTTASAPLVVVKFHSHPRLAPQPEPNNVEQLFSQMTYAGHITSSRLFDHDTNALCSSTKLRKVFFQFRCTKWYLPDRRHHPSIHPFLDEIVEIASLLVKRNVMVYLVGCQDWHPSWYSATKGQANPEMEAILVNTIAAGGEYEFVRALPHSQLKNHFDADIYSAIDSW